MVGALIELFYKIKNLLAKILSFLSKGSSTMSPFGKLLRWFRAQMVALSVYIAGKFTNLGRVFWHLVSIISLLLMGVSTFTAFSQGIDILAVTFGGTDGVFDLISKMASSIFGSNTTTGLISQIDGELAGTSGFCTPACTLTNMSNSIGLGWALNQSLTALINVIAFEVNFWLWALSMKMASAGVRNSLPVLYTKK